MIELGKIFDLIRNGGAGRASSSLFQRSDGRRLMTTLTDELFLPTRIVYRVKDREELLSKIQNLRCMMFDPFRARWMWQYEFEATRIGFPVKYRLIPREREPLVLASCYLLDSGATVPGMISDVESENELVGVLRQDGGSTPQETPIRATGAHNRDTSGSCGGEGWPQ